MTEIANYISKDELRFGVLQMIMQYDPWDWWSTWTFANEYSVESARKAFEKFMRKELPDAKCFCAIEANRFRQGTHVHACVGNVFTVSRKATWSKWFEKYGECRIVPYDEQKDCSEYMTKYMTKKLLWWNIIIPANLPAIDLWHDQRLEAARRYCREQGAKKKLRGRK